MLSYSDIKKIAKGNGVKLEKLAQDIGYSYAGMLKGLKDNSLKFEAREQLAEILHIPLNDLLDNNYPINGQGEELVLLEEKIELLKKLNQQYEQQIEVLKQKINKLEKGQS